MKFGRVFLWLILTGVAIPQERAPQVDSQPSFAKLFNSWLQQDVRWIISNEERNVALTLKTDEDRRNFVDSFWWNHNSVPAASPNEFKQRHYERLLNAKRLFSTDLKSGWDTDQGHVYVELGPPAWIRTQSGAPDPTPAIILKCPGNVQSPATSVVWRYLYARNGDPLTITFADYCGRGELQQVASEPEPEQPKPSRYMTVCEGRFTFDLSKGPVAFECLRLPPSTRFKDLQEVVSHKVTYKLLPFDVDTKSLPATDATQMLEMEISAKVPGSQCEMDVAKEPLHVFGQLTTWDGHIAETFEGTMNYSNCGGTGATYSRSMPLFRDRYRLDIAVEDTNEDKIGTFTKEIDLSSR